MRDIETLEDRLSDRSNAIGFLRLVLALSVLLSHAKAQGGWGREILVDWGRNLVTLGTLGVVGFFALSGMLLAHSWTMHPKPVDFLRNRALRILPAFWVCLVVAAFVISPACFYADNHTLTGFNFMGSGGALAFVVNNSGLLVRQIGVSGTLRGIPFPLFLDAPLWTLFWEALCYVVLLLLAMAGLITKSGRLVVVAIAIALMALSAVVFHDKLTLFPIEGVQFWSLPARVLAAFALGVVLYLYADRIPFHAGWAAAAAGLSLVSLYFGWFDYGGIVPFTYLIVWLGLVLPVRDLERRGDISYGMYLYAFPICQLLTVLSLNQLGYFPYVGVALAAVVPVAIASWLVVERPALRLKASTRPAPAQPETPTVAFAED